MRDQGNSAHWFGHSGTYSGLCKYCPLVDVGDNSPQKPQAAQFTDGRDLSNLSRGTAVETEVRQEEWLSQSDTLNNRFGSEPETSRTNWSVARGISGLNYPTVFRESYISRDQNTRKGSEPSH